MSRGHPVSILSLLALFVGLLLPSTAHAYAWMIKHGFAKCGTCHTDPGGGETLTPMGRVQAQRLLSFGGGGEAALRERSRFLFGALPPQDSVSLGGSYRHLALYKLAKGDAPSDFTHFPMQLDLYGAANLGRFVVGGSLGVASGIEGVAHARAAQLNREQGQGFLLLGRTHYLGVRLGDFTQLRVGRLNLPFGVRMPEHVMWVREATRTDRESDQQHGASLSYARGRWRIEGMVSFGNFQVNPDQFRERGYVASVEYLHSPTLAYGISSQLLRSNRDRLLPVDDMLRQAHGVHGRLGLSRKLAFVGELDLLRETQRRLGYVAYVYGDYEPLRGVHLMLTGEALDGGRREGAESAPGSGRLRGGLWGSIQWFGFSHFDVRVDAIARSQEAFTLQGQVHWFL